MNKYAVIFDVLKDVRIYSEKHSLDAVLDAVKLAEDLALTEVCNVNLDEHGIGYGTLLWPDFSDISPVKH